MTFFKTIAENWPSNIVARTHISRFTGGAISEGYLANLDCQNKGPAGRFRIGLKIVYPIVELVAWLESRSEIVPERTRQTK